MKMFQRDQKNQIELTDGAALTVVGAVPVIGFAIFVYFWFIQPVLESLLFIYYWYIG